MGMIHTEGGRKTLAELAISAGWKYDTLWKKAKREFPSVGWTAKTEVPADIAEQLITSGRRNSAAKKTAPRKAAKKDFIRTPAPILENTPAPVEPGQDTAPARREWGWRQWVILFLLIAPTLASLRNMYNVTYLLSESSIDAALLTVVLSISALGFVVASGRTWYTLCLAGLLILFESFCNLTRIYGGLMGVGANWNPTRFLGLVTDIFGSGSHQTAIFLAAFTAFFIAAVQYAAVFELNKK
jgi:hypothetical protein